MTSFKKSFHFTNLIMLWFSGQPVNPVPPDVRKYTLCINKMYSARKCSIQSISLVINQYTNVSNVSMHQ